MNAEQIRLVQSSFEQVRPSAQSAVVLFYERLFQSAPALRPWVKDERRDGALLVSTLALAVRGLDRPEIVMPTLESLGRRLADLGMTDAHYAAAQSALLWTLDQRLGSAFTEAMREAWTIAFAQLTGIMRAAGADRGPPGAMP